MLSFSLRMRGRGILKVLTMPVLRYSELFQNADQLVPPGHYVLGDSAFPLLWWLLTSFRDFWEFNKTAEII